ncbi:hypothetical protein [Brevibacterium aurantiacum]|uniref:hypothetical protein n=1 Tax=Brevibacterium aurantiacum TaxID=273384 RepID=UPI00114225C4|nr:hypothetical protein [Brevibacterium aurantiacum]
MNDPVDGAELVGGGPQWADQHPEALQELVDPTITLAGGGGDAHRGWELPAGWVPIVNRLHQDLVDLLGDYEVVRVGNKMSSLRYAINRPEAATPEVNGAVNDLLREAGTESLATCDLCSGSATGELSIGVTRCERHQPTRERLCPGALARPPGWQPGGKPARRAPVVR